MRMSRFDANRVPYPTQDRLFGVFCEVVCRLRSQSEVRDFFKDLLNRQERLMLVRRLQVAGMLLQEKTYREIQDRLRVGPNTIARVERWLHFGRNGYRRALTKDRG